MPLIAKQLVDPTDGFVDQHLPAGWRNQDIFGCGAVALALQGPLRGQVQAGSGRQLNNESLRRWAARLDLETKIDVKLERVRRHHGVAEFATRNVKDLQGYGFERVWDPCA